MIAMRPFELAERRADRIADAAQLDPATDVGGGAVVLDLERRQQLADRHLRHADVIGGDDRLVVRVEVDVGGDPPADDVERDGLKGQIAVVEVERQDEMVDRDVAGADMAAGVMHIGVEPFQRVDVERRVGQDAGMAADDRHHALAALGVELGRANSRSTARHRGVERLAAQRADDLGPRLATGGDRQIARRGRNRRNGR